MKGLKFPPTPHLECSIFTKSCVRDLLRWPLRGIARAQLLLIGRGLDVSARTVGIAFTERSSRREYRFRIPWA
ncbi:hypothetical protein OPQ81_009848 [Rhizoctonia solani]|nr:hypothetical protein OPQ81_009848 [Rhizoctonia solani]